MGPPSCGASALPWRPRSTTRSGHPLSYPMVLGLARPNQADPQDRADWFALNPWPQARRMPRRFLEVIPLLLGPTRWLVQLRMHSPGAAIWRCSPPTRSEPTPSPVLVSPLVICGWVVPIVESRGNGSGSAARRSRLRTPHPHGRAPSPTTPGKRMVWNGSPVDCSTTCPNPKRRATCWRQKSGGAAPVTSERRQPSQVTLLSDPTR